jgi:hypothetical protein
VQYTKSGKSALPPMKKVTAPTYHHSMRLTSFGTMNRWNHSAQKRCFQILLGCILSVGVSRFTFPVFANSIRHHLIVKHFDNDTIANIATGISCSSAVLHFANTWQPVFALILAIVGIISGLLAIVYWSKKINRLQ